MFHDAIKEELIELLRDSREQARFLGELGIENISLDSVNNQNAAALRAITSTATVPARLLLQVDSLPPAEAPLCSIKPANPPPADSLFVELAATAPSLAKSSENLEQIWTD